MSRADMIGPRRLVSPGSTRSISFLTDERRPLSNTVGPVTTRGTINGMVPSCHEAPAPQPALVLRDDLIGKSGNHPAVLLAKAIQAHADAIAKAENMFEEAKPPIDVSTPQHEHARLVAKRQYLVDKLDAHKRAMHPEDHPDVVHRNKVLGQVSRNIDHLEGQGITSGTQHHSDWMHHYSRIPEDQAESMHPEEINTALHAHMGALAGPKAKEMRRDVAGTHSGGSTTVPHTSLPLGQYKRLGGDVQAYREAATKKTSMTGAAQKEKDIVGTAGTAVTRQSASVSAPRPENLTVRSKPMEAAAKSLPLFVDLSKSKSDDWISNKISLLMHEGKPQDQAIAIAYNMAGRSKKKAKKSMGLYIAQ
jgi:hypothetical protein